MDGGCSDEVVVPRGGTVGRSLVQQNVELRRRLNDEHAHYRRQLNAYHDEQQRQSLLVHKLQAQVLPRTSMLRHLVNVLRFYSSICL